MSAYRKDMMTMTRKQLVLTLTSLTGGIGFGLLICFLLFPPKKTIVQSSLQETTTSQSALVETDSQEPDSVPTDLHEIVQLESVSEQRIALYQMLENKSGEQIAELLGSTLTFDSSENLYSAQRILFVELVRVEPEKALELIWETERTRWSTLLDEVAIHWGLEAPTEALTAFASLKEPWKGRAIKTFFQHQNRLDETELADLADSLNLTNYFVHWAYEVELAQVLHEPRSAFKLTLEADISTFQKNRVLSRITRHWIEQTSTDDIRAKLNLVFEVLGDTRGIWDPVVTEIAKLNPSYVWEQLTAMSQEIQTRFGRSVFKVWVESDPEAALLAITDPEYLDSNDGNMSYMLYPWVRAISDRFLEHISLIPEDEKQSAIRIAVNHLASSLPPAEVLTLLAQLRERGFDTSEATDSFVRVWSRNDALAAVEWVVQNMELGRYDGSMMLNYAIDELTIVDPDKAMKLALEQPVKSGMDYAVVNKLLREGDFEKALALAPKVRVLQWYEPIYNRVAYFYIGEGKIEEALALEEKVEDSEKPRFYQNLVWNWLYSDADSFLENLPNFPTSEIRAIVAAEAIRTQQSSGFLTEKELEFVRSFVPNESD
ncbi:MAG: hypothetical protein F4X56_08335 [Gammaproteobacteria bacterium]|nr:hypothetical protein [Gammaproteobacteria bacterium]